MNRFDHEAAIGQCSDCIWQQSGRHQGIEGRANAGVMGRGESPGRAVKPSGGARDVNPTLGGLLGSV
jgi:hypothetical protein